MEATQNQEELGNDFFDPTRDLPKSGGGKQGKAKFPFDKEGVLATIKSYRYETGVVLEFEAVSNGGVTRKILNAPLDEDQRMKMVKNMVWLASSAAGVQIEPERAPNFESFADMLFKNRELPEAVLIKTTYSDDVITVDAAQAEGKTPEELKALFSPWVNISRKGAWWKPIGYEKITFQYKEEDASNKYRDITDYEVVVVSPDGGSTTSDVPAAQPANTIAVPEFPVAPPSKEELF